MKQVVQEMSTGTIKVEQVPDPEAWPGFVQVRTAYSVISAGTEGTQVAGGGKSLLARVREKPELLSRGVGTFRREGLAGLRQQIESKYSGYTPLGYSAAGVVEQVGEGVEGVRPGDLVACAGAGYAVHAERISVPRNLCAGVPEGVGLDAAAYTTIGAIAMQGVRQAEVTLGENVAVIGLGLVGLLAAQILRAAGCRVLGVDPSDHARLHGGKNECDAATTPDGAAEAAQDLTRGAGMDAVIICAAAASNQPVVLAGELARSRGRVVMVGATGMDVPRDVYYMKELSFLLSRSYGPGRYDPSYEEMGLDYPYDYVRFTEQRNLQCFLDMTGQGTLAPDRLTTHRFPLAEADRAFAMLKESATNRVGVVLTYPEQASPPQRTVSLEVPKKAATGDTVGIGFIGAGSYASGMLLPRLKDRPDVQLRGVVTQRPDMTLTAASRFGFAFTAGSAEDVLADETSNLVFVATRHDSHADYAMEALAAGKSVWVEKPLALTEESLKDVVATMRKHPGHLVVGFNRRFHNLAVAMKVHLTGDAPLMLHYRVNAGALPRGHWAEDRKLGGGRLLGEGCHFFDFMRFITGAEAETVTVHPLASDRDDLLAASNFAASVSFGDGSVATLTYTSQGSPGLGKEQIEGFRGIRSVRLDDFLEATFFTGPGSEKKRGTGGDKGQRNMLSACLAALTSEAEWPLTPDDVIASSVLTLAAQESLEQRTTIRVADVAERVQA